MKNAALIEYGDDKHAEKLKVTSAKLLQEIIRQGGDITKIEIDDKLWKNRIQYYDPKDPFSANLNRKQRDESVEPVNEEDEEKVDLQEGTLEHQAPTTKFGWGGARVKGVHSLNTKAHQKKALQIAGSSKLHSKISKNQLPCTHVKIELSE